MLNPKADCLDYGKLLRPPDGYVLDQAVATTYSADLQTLISIPVALVYAQTLEGDLSEVRIELLEAIKEFSNKVRVYHQKGQLHVPKANWLYAFMEDALVPILPENAFTSFHPKVWLIRYRAKNEDAIPHFRLIVLSRNLTFDRSWDVACSLDGKPQSKELNDNQPLLKFFGWLDKQHPIPNAKTLLNELARVKFDAPEKFGKLLFHPIGIPGFEKNPVEQQKSDNALIISRFLHPKALQTIRNNTAKEMHLLSEKVDLLTIPISVREQFRSYHLNEWIIDGESIDAAEDGNPDQQKQHLHAKLFIFRTMGENSRWFLGSANATEAAFCRNVEFLVELRTDAYQARPRKVLGTLVEEYGTGAFVELPPDQEAPCSKAEAQRNEIREFEYNLLKADMEACLKPGSQKDTYDLVLRVTAPRFPSVKDFKVTVKPFNIESTPQALASGSSKDLRFSAISESYLSRFLHLTITGRDLPTRQFLICVPMTGLPRQRLESIFRKVITSPDKFFQYLRFLLAEEVCKEDLIRVSTNKVVSSSEVGAMAFDAPLYEQLLVAASRAPSKLRAVDDVIRKLNTEESSVIPADFLELWNSFRPFIPKPIKSNG